MTNQDLERLLEIVRVENYQEILNVEELAEMDTIIYKIEQELEKAKRYEYLTDSNLPIDSGYTFKVIQELEQQIKESEIASDWYKNAWKRKIQRYEKLKQENQSLKEKLEKIRKLLIKISRFNNEGTDYQWAFNKIEEELKQILDE